MEPVIVTGSAGFIGSHVVDALVADGRHVVVIDHLSTGNAANVANEADLEMVTVSVTDPGRDRSINVIGTLNVLEATRRHRAPTVFTSTGVRYTATMVGGQPPETHPPAPVRLMGHPSGRPKHMSVLGRMPQELGTRYVGWRACMGPSESTR